MTEQLYLIQCLCENGHSVVGLSFPATSAEEAKAKSPEMREKLEEVFKTKVFNRWCAICGSANFSFEIGAVKGNSIEEAEKNLSAAQSEELMIRALLEASGQTYDAQCANRN